MIALTLLIGCFPSDAFFEEQCLRTEGNWRNGSCISDTAAGANRGYDENTAYAFITSRTVSGNIAELGAATLSSPHDVADGICNDAADAADVPGTFRAWLSTAATDAIDHVDGDGPWVSTWGGVELFPNAAALKGTALSTNWGTEYGERFPTYDYVWTGTALGGRRSSNCANWTSLSGDDWGIIGEPAYATHEWTDGAPNPCYVPGSLICLSTMSGTPSR